MGMDMLEVARVLCFQWLELGVRQVIQQLLHNLMHNARPLCWESNSRMVERLESKTFWKRPLVIWTLLRQVLLQCLSQADTLEAGAAP